MLTACCHCCKDDKNQIVLEVGQSLPQPIIRDTVPRRRSIMTLVSKQNLKVGASSLKSYKPSQATTYHTGKISLVNSVESTIVCSKEMLVRDEQIRLLQEENERYERILERELGPLKYRYELLKGGYMQQMGRLDELEGQLIKLEQRSKVQN